MTTTRAEVREFDTVVHCTSCTEGVQLSSPPTPMWRWSRCVCTRSSCCSSKSCLAAARDLRLYLQHHGGHRWPAVTELLQGRATLLCLQAWCFPSWCTIEHHPETECQGWHLDTFICSGSPTAAATRVTPSSTGSAIQSTSGRPPHSPASTRHALGLLQACSPCAALLPCLCKGQSAVHASSEGNRAFGASGEPKQS